MSFLSLSSFILLSALALRADAKCQKYVDSAQAAAAALQSEYFTDGTYGDQAIWIGAVEAYYLNRLDEVAGSSNYTDVITTVFNGQEDYLTNGGSFDDVQWVSIAYLAAGDQENAKKYYDIAASARDSDYCGGGLFWSADRDYKNSITNELFLALSGYMHEVTQDQKYLDNLNDLYDWFKGSKLQGDDGLYNDGLTKDGSCANNGQTTWTYNQGVVLVGLGYLYKNNADQALLDAAYKIIDATMDKLTWDNGLRELCETTSDNQCNADQTSFKGIFMYYLAWFLEVSGKDDGTKYADFIKKQADLVLANAASGDSKYTNLWYGADEGSAKHSSQSQGSALGALLAAAKQTC
ncbi:glycoside hydrolase family 76 protein [Schizophyllum amplum]|uniref:Glycoside hydrolase family 76 protein n=1 Tax=Schizophyllum amplum TaxID=97359 RepID=A0A550CVU1_9AGAR|nr:glycoside hydrolase family 76 protein [Auriculariopsis ampla]